MFDNFPIQPWRSSSIDQVCPNNAANDRCKQGVEVYETIRVWFDSFDSGSLARLTHGIARESGGMAPGEVCITLKCEQDVPL